MQYAAILTGTIAPKNDPKKRFCAGERGIIMNASLSNGELVS